MKNTLVLENPIMIDGKQVRELTYDALAISADLFLAACSKSAAIDKTKTINIKLRENDYALHMYLGMAAVVAANPQIAMDDLERCSGYDLLSLADIGMLFTLRRLEGISGENNSDEPSETTPALSTQASGKSEGNG